MSRHDEQAWREAAELGHLKRYTHKQPTPRTTAWVIHIACLALVAVIASLINLL